MSNPLIKSLIEEDSFFSDHEMQAIDLTLVPKHVAIIPDGNRRWARQQGLSIEEGHRKGADTLMNIVKSGKELGIQVLTFYTFSTENWSRASEEVEALFWLIEHYLKEQCEEMVHHGIRLRTIGQVETMPEAMQEAIAWTKEATKGCSAVDMVLAINYGGRDEICRAVRQLADLCAKSCVQADEIDETMIAKFLDTSLWGDPDLVIRTSGEMRISNFLLWQASYAEFHKVDLLWPDFTPEKFLEAILHYQERERRMGGC